MISGTKLVLFDKKIYCFIEFLLFRQIKNKRIDFSF